MPTLREMRSDIPLLAERFLARHSESRTAPDSFSPEAMSLLSAYDWPGNIRQLENEVRRAIVLSHGQAVAPADLSESIREGGSMLPRPDSFQTYDEADRVRSTLKERVTALEIHMIRDVLAETGGDRRKASRLLGLSHQGLLNKVRRYGLG
jgi:DNA-binding NtrC family response regulator